MPDGTEVHFEIVKSVHLQKLWEWHQEHVAINFPHQLPDRGIFERDILHGHGIKRIAVCDGLYVGFIWFDINWNEYEDKTQGDIKYVHVDPKHRRMGLGEVMMQYAHDNMAGSDYYVLGTHVDNASAIKLYKKFGYKPYRLIMRRDSANA